MATKLTPSLTLQIRREVSALIAAGSSAAEISTRVFGPRGLLAQMAGNRAAREEFVGSATSRWLKRQLAAQREKEVALFEREIATLSGRLTLVVPKSLHAALKREAAGEGISLAELLRLKVAVPYRDMAAHVAGLTTKASRQLPRTL